MEKEGRRWEGRGGRGREKVGKKRREGKGREKEGGKRRERSERGGQSEEKGREGEDKRQVIPVVLKMWPHVTENSLEQRMDLVFLRAFKHTVNKMREHL